MNKIFKVVWSKTKECYVVVSEVAKNNSGKKKVLASVLAALAVVGAGATQVDAASFGAGGGNAAADASISIGGGYSGPKTAANDKFAIAIGDNASATGKSSISMGYKAETNGQVSIAIGEESKVKKSEGTAVGPGAVVEERFGAAFGHEAKAQKEYATAIGSGAIGNGYESQAIGRQAETTGIRAVAVGTLAQAKNDNAIAIGNNSLADGTNSIAMGKKNKAHSFDAIAIGNSNNSRSSSAISIGSDNTADVAYGLTDAQYDALPYDVNNLTDSSKTDPRKGLTSAIAIGRSNKAANVETVAIGREVNAMKTGAIGMGSRINATGDYAIAIGNSSGGGTVEAGDYAVAVGFKAKATGGRSIAQGGAATAAADRSIAMGLRSNVQDQKASSTYTYSGTGGAVVGGVNTTTKTIHKGTGTATANDIYDSGDEIAIGTSASVSDESNSAVVIGNGAKTEGNAHYSVVVGKGSYANASDGVVVGQGSYVNARESVAIGQTANVSGAGNVRSQAIGFGATVSGTTAYDALAIGSGAQVTDVTSGVALGSGSEVSRKTSDTKSIGLNTKYVDGTRVRNRSYEATVTAAGDKWDDGAQLGAVSVGNDNQKRQIINVAAGNQDTDAVNVAQLKNVGVRVGGDTNTATINGQKVAADFLAYNGQLNIKGDNNRVTTVSENDANGKDANVNVKFDYDGLVKAKTGSAVTVDQKTDGNGKTYFEIDAAAGSKTVLADGKNTTVTGAGTTASPYKVNVEGALTGISSITNNGGGKIEFATGGTTISGGPVNVSNNKITGVANGDVNATSTDAVNGSQLHAVKAAERHIAPTTAGHEYTVDSNGDVTMTYLDGNNNAVANEKAVIKGIAKQDLSNINDAGKKVITGLGTIVKAGDNVNVSESSDATTGQKTYTVNAVTPAVYTKADGTKVYKRPDGTFTTNSNLAAGNNVDKGDVITSFMDGNGNTTGGNMVINNVGSAIKNAGNAGDSFLTKLDAANTATPNAAVNVSDLKNTADGLTDKGLKFDANEGGVKTNKLGSTVTVKGTGALSAGKAYADEYNTANIRTNIEQGSDGNTTINVGLAKELKGINSISNGNSSITLNSNPGGTNNTPAVQITGGNLSMGNGTTNNKIVNLAPGTNDTDAVNYSQIKGLRTEVKQGANVTVSKTQGTDGHDIYTISAAATGGTASSWNIKSSADTANGGATATGHNANAVNISDQKTVEMVAGKNLTVKQDTTTDGAKVEFALSDNIVAGKDGVNGKDGSVGATGKDGSSVVINGADGSIGMTGPKGQDGKDGINGRDGANISMTSAKGEQVLVNRDPAHSADTDKAERIVYVPKDASGNPIQGADGKNIVREVATMDDGLKFAGDDAQGTDKSKVIAKKLNNTVDIIGGANSANLTNNNIGVNNDNGKLKVQLAKTIDLTKDGSVTTGNTKVDNSGVTITAPTGGATTNVTLTQSGLDNGGNKITNVKAGTDNTDAVNVKQLKDTEKHIKPGSYAVQSDGSVTLNYQDGNNNDLTETAKITGIAKQDLSNIDNAGKKVITGLGSIVEAGDNVTVTSTENTTTGQKTYTVNAVTPAVYTTPDGEKLTKKSDGKFYKADGSEYTGGDIITSFENPNANSIPAGKNSTTDGGMIVNNIGSAIKNQNPTMPAGQTATYLDKLKAAADAGSNVKNAAVNVSDLHNTAEALKSNELHIRPTVTNRTGETVNQNAGGTAESYKYDAATQSVTLKYNDGTGAGVTGTEAKIDLSDLANQITSGYTFKTNATENGGKVVNDAATPAAETAVANGGVVNYAAGKNLTVKQDIEKDGTGAATGKQTYTYALADEIGIGEKGQPGVAGKDGVDGKIGVNGKDGSSVVINGKDGSIGMTGPQGKDGKDGINGRDGANISMTSAKGEQVLINRDPAHSADTDKAERIVYVPKDASGNPIQDANGKNIVREVATMDDGLKFTGNNESTVNNNKLNTLVKVQGEGTKEDTNAAGAKEIQTSDGTKFESAKDNIAVVADGTNTLTVKLNKKLKGLDSVQTKTVELGDHTTPGSTTNITYNTGDNRIEYTTPGTTDTKKVATTDDIWTIQGNGTDVAPVNGKVNVKAGENILITTPATADGSMTINAVTPAVYTDKDGNKLTKDKDGKFHKPDGTEVAASDVITSIQDAAGNTTGGHSIVNNVGSAINNHATPGVTSPTYLDKLDAASGDTKTQNAAVNVTDLKNTADGLTDKGLNFTGNNESTVNKHKLGSLVKVQGEGTKEGTNAAGAKEIQTSDGTKFESAKDNIAVEANNGDTLTVKLNKNLKGLDSVQTKTVELGDHTTPGGTTNITYNSGDKRIEYTTPGATGTPETKKVATTDDIWTIQGNGTDVAPVNGKVNVKAGENILITTPTTADGSMTINAVTPAIYTDKNGNKVVKRPDGTYTTNLDGSAGNDVAANDVIVSFKDAAGNTTGGNSIVNNVGSAIKNQTPTMPAGQTATYLDKLKAAADDTKTQNAAVNVSDLHNTANALKDSELHIAPTAVKTGSTEVKGGTLNAAGTENVYKYDAATKKVTLTYNDGNGKAVADTKAVIDLSELAGSIQNYGFKTNAAGNLETGTNATATAVASGKTVTYAAGKNLTVKQEIGTDGNQTYTYALNKDLTNLDKVVVNGKAGIDGKDGVSITGPKGESAPGAKDGQDGKVGIAGKDGKDAVSISGKDGVGHIGLQGPKGAPGADGASLDISTDHGTQTLVKPEANNDNKSERIVYVPKDKDGNPLKDTDGNVIKREVATMDDGLKFAGDDGTVIKKALGTQLDIIGGADSTKLTDNNIGVNNDNGKLKVQLAQNIDLTKDGSVTMGNTKVNNDGITITKPATATDPAKTVSLTGDGLNNGGNKITNVAAGTANTDAVNVKQLKDKVTTVESSDSSIKVVDKNVPTSATYDPDKGHQYDITINNQSVVEHAQTPVVYTDKDGHKVYKIVDTAGNVTFNTEEDGTGTTVQPNEVIASMNNGGDSTTTPMKLNNVGSSIQDPNSTDTFLKQLEDANKNTPNGAVNVSDLKKTSDALIDKGLVFDANNADPKTNKLGSKVTIAGTGTLATGENFADKYNTSNIRTNITQDLTTGNTTVEIGLNKNLKGLESVSVPGKDGVDGQDGVSITGKDGANGLDGKVSIGKDGKDAVSISGKDGIGHIGLTGAAGKDGTNTKADITVKEGKAGVDGKDGVDGITRIVYNDKDGNEHQVATHDDGLKFTGNNVSTENKHKLNSVVKVQGEGVTENATSGKLEVNGQEFKSATGNIAVVADGDKTLTVKMNKNLNLTKDGSVTMGDTVVNNNGITIKASTTPGTTDVKLTNQGLDNGGNKITNVAAGTANTDAVNVKQLNDKVTTVTSSDSSIKVVEKNDPTSTTYDATKGHQYDITINSQGVVNNAQTPVVYTKEDGTKVYLVDGKFYDNPQGNGAEVPKAQVIASMNNADGSTNTPMKLNNVGSSIANEAGATFLDKLDSAKTNTPNGAVNVSDLQSTAKEIREKGLNFGAQSGNDIHKDLGEKLEIVGGGTKTDDKYDASNIKTMTKDGKVVIALDKDLKADSVTVGEKGAPGKDGVDGKIGVNGADGSAVVINGKDGSIGLNGKDGANGITIKGDKGVDGVDGVNGTNGITRIVYQDKDGNNHEVATHDDGMKFAGDDGQTNQDTNPQVIKKHLNKVVDIVGGADKTKLTDNNIGVNNDGGKLRVQLANELSGITKISNGGSSISIADVPAGATSPAVTISGGNLSMGDGTHNNKIVNLAAGTNDTDAVNYKQLKDSRTTVTSQDGSVTITPTPNGDSMNYDLKVNPPLDPRVDQLAEEVGRVGAQGAALSALKPIQYDPLEPTQIMAGYGNYRGNSAVALGVAHYKNESTLIHGGVSWAGGSSHMMANAGVTWKVGNRDSEAAVADRYRKGPISSAYAMQQEMAAMKAQNAGLKGEVSDLKAENEQMKAQIAAMMAKLGL